MVIINFQFSIINSARVHILGIPIDSVTMEQAIERLRTLLDAGGQSHVMTPNNEMLVEAGHNAEFRRVLCGAALNLPDSIGLVWASRLTRQRLPERVAGIDVVERLCVGLTEEDSVFLLGSREGVGRRAWDVLFSRNPRLRFAGAFSGSPRDEDAQEVIRMINEAAPHLLLVAYGAPEQDLWIAKHLHELPSVRVAMGVGGTFDFLAGVQRRAPKILRSLGFEWLWRLIQEPRRCRRIWNAVVVFPFLVLFRCNDCAD